MEILKLNETPVRTSRNFNINNIKIKDIEIPGDIAEFRNMKITGENSKLKIEHETSDIDLIYGLSEEFTTQVKTQANQKLRLTVDSKTNKETIIDFKFNDENKFLVDDIEIIAEEAAKATIIIKYKSNKGLEAYHNGLIRVKAKANSSINIIVVNVMNCKSNNFIAMQNIIENNAKVNYTIVDFGGRNSITNYYTNLIGDNSDNKLNTIYIGKEEQLLDLNYIAELRGKKSNIDIEVQGALTDSAKKHFKGTIDFKKGCKKATGNENESCMLLSDKAKSIALPMLLCSEEEVEGNHSNSAGKIGEKELFYIMSRGFEQKEAMKLMVRAKFNKILANIKNEELNEEIVNKINKMLD